MVSTISATGGIGGRALTPHPLSHMTDADAQGIVSAALPRDVWERLFPFQQEGVRFGVKAGGRVLLADEMGLGKTCQAICIASCFPADWPLLVVCPSSMRFVWAAELRSWLPGGLQPAPDDLWVISSGADLSKRMAAAGTSFFKLKSSDLSL